MTLTIDGSICTRCGICSRECPSRAIHLEPGGPFAIDQSACVRCGHCAVVCPADAVRSDEGPFLPWEPPGIEPERVAALLRGKRSIRRYTERPVETALLEELLLTGSLAATASNSQDSVATILTGKWLDRCHEGVRSLFAPLPGLLRNPLVRFILRFTEARRYVLNPRTLEALDELAQSRKSGPDRLFHGAPALVLLSAPARNKRFGKSDCVLAGAHMMIHAESLGLGSCVIGFAEVALGLRGRLRRELGVPKGHRVNLVFTLGYPDVRHYRLPPRKPLSAPTE